MSGDGTRPTPAPRAEIPERAASERVRINVSWLLKLRRAAVLGQLATIAAVALVARVPLPLLPLLLITALGLVANVGLQLWFLWQSQSGPEEDWVRVGRPLLGSVLLFDILLLIALLYFTGGAGNPFAAFFIVNLVLSTVMLGWRWLRVVIGTAIVGYAGLILYHVPLIGVGGPTLTYHMPGSAPHPRDASLFAWGALVSFIAVAVFTVYFVRSLTFELREKERELEAIRKRREDAARLEALANLAAGAAHELSSPLSTIAVVAKELERELERAGDGGQIEDAQLIRTEVARCRKIIDQMSLDAGESVGEEMVPIRAADLIERAIEKLEGRDRVHVELGPTADAELLGPMTALTRALRALVRNALDASPPNATVDVTVEPQGRHLAFCVTDRGSGMDRETLSRAGDPFFTTKDPGRGMGLGLFVVRTLAERLEGRLDLQSEPGRGTTARLELPARE